MSTSLFDELQWRGLIYDSTPEVREVLETEKVVGYIGFDPTADSLHIGSLVQIMALARLQRFGHQPIAVAGGGTGLIGDPSGKTQERQLLSEEQVHENLKGIEKQLAAFLDLECTGNPALVVNNAEWLCSITLVEFLRDIGKCFTANAMLQRESVRRRLESEDGISYTELSYMLLQAFDFLQLYDRFGCVLQLGGSDQWGNVLSGIDLIRRLRGGKAHGLVLPLITTASGAKFGKTESGTIWLDPRRTSPYRYYQYWLNTEDANVIDYLQFFTWLERNEIIELREAVQTSPEARDAQRRLAAEVTRMTHGEDALQRAIRISTMFFSSDVAQLSADEVEEVVSDAPSGEVPAEQIGAEGIPLVDLLVSCGLAASKGDARRTVKGGGIYLSNRRMDDPGKVVGMDESIEGKLFLLRKGKKQYHVARIIR